MTPRQLFESGKLSDAITALGQELRAHPTDAGRRAFLTELLCFAGLFERADKQLDALGYQDPQTMVGVALFRQLLRAEQARQQCFTEGRLPEFLAAPSPQIQRYLEASIGLREGRDAGARELLAQAEENRIPLAGACNGKAFDDLRDLDDLTAGVFEVLTSTGKYYWIPMEDIECIEFYPPNRAQDLLWRRVHMVVGGEGPDGEVFLPAIYPALEEANEASRLGRITDWRGDEDGPIRGQGLRTFLVGNEAFTIMELETLEIHEAATSHG